MASNRESGYYEVPNTLQPGETGYALLPASGARYNHDSMSVTNFKGVTEEYRTAADSRHLPA